MEIAAPKPEFRFDFSHAGIIRLVTAIIGVAMALYHIWVILPPFVGGQGTPEAVIFRGTHLLFAMSLTFLIYRRAGKGDAPSPLDYVFLVLATAPVLYLFWNYDYLVNRIYYVDDMSTMDMAMAVVLVVMILEATRRLIGWALPLTAIAFLVYALFVAGVEPMTSVVDVTMKMRDDAVTDGGIAEKIVANAPETEDHYFVVPKVVE